MADAAEELRLKELAAYEILDTAPSASFERVVDTFKDRFNVPIALISLIDRDRQWFKAKRGIDITETPREVAFCNETIKSHEVLVVPDASEDPRFAGNPFVTANPGIRFYAGAPLISPSGARLGSACIVDFHPRQISEVEVKALRETAACVVDFLEAHKARIETERSAETAVQQRKLLFQHEEHLRRDEVLLKQVARLAKIGAWTLDAGKHELVWTPEIYEMFEVDRSFVPTFSSVAAFIEDPYRGEVQQAIFRVMAEGGQADTRAPVRTAKGKSRWLRSIAEPEFTDGKLVRMIGTLQDITDQVEAQAEIHRLAFSDAVTGLPNRHAFLQDIGRMSQQKTDRLALLMIDLDEFKAANELFGHDGGDKVLNILADRFRSSSADGKIYRIGGDEFALLSTRTTKRELARLGKDLVSAAAHPIEICGQAVRIGASVGIARFPSQADSETALMRAADVALDTAKKAGRGRWKLFQKCDAERFERRHTLLQEAKAGLSGDQFTVAFQPIIDLRTREIDGFEALVRWRHPSHGLLAAGAFTDVLDDLQIGCRLSERALRLALAQFADWTHEGLPVGTLSVNLAPGQLSHDRLLEDIKALLDRAKLTPESLKFEITESVLLGRESDVEKRLQQLRDFGIFLELDDFGTGFASLSHLRKVPAGAIKIDKSFVLAMAAEAADRTIVKTMIDLAHGLGMSVVAEGIETAEASAALQLMGCDRGQGYFFSRPMLAADVPLFVANWSPAKLSHLSSAA